MKKNIILIITTCLLCIILTGCNNKNNKIELQTNGGVPYEWKYEIKDESIVKIDKTKSKEKTPNTPGGVIYKTYYLKGLKEGTTTITFKYTNFTNNTIDSEKNYTINVDKNLNVTITEK